MIIALSCLDDTEKFANKLASNLKNDDILLFFGDIGAGKTTFTRFLAQALEFDSRQVSSPTFSLLHIYEGAKMKIAHIDLYRLGEGIDIFQTELAEYLPFSEGVTVVEWSEYLGDAINELKKLNMLMLKIQWLDEDKREISLEGFGDWKQRFKRLIMT